MTEYIRFKNGYGEEIEEEYENIKFNEQGLAVCTPSVTDVEPKVTNGLMGDVEFDTADVYPPSAVVCVSINNSHKAYGGERQ